MDQLKVALGWLKRHHFWVLCVIVVGIALYCWNGASGALQQEFESNRGTIKSEFDAQQRLRGEQFHANETIHTRQVEEIKKQSEKVGEAWGALYESQREAVLKWPAELSERFRTEVEKLKFGDPIPVDLRNHYMNYVGTHFKKLPEKIGARVLPDSAGGGGGGGGGRGGDIQSMMSQIRGGGEPGAAGDSEDTDYIVQWLDQQVVRDQLDMPSEPSSVRIWVTQEDLWTYHTLLQIIANTNKAAGADRYSNAAVRVIQSLEVGRSAAFASGNSSASRILMVAPAGAEGGGGSEMPPMDRSGGAEMAVADAGGRGAPGDAPMTEAEETAMLMNGRYLDAQGVPAATPGVEFKRLPIRMTLLMDQRWLPQLLAECANAPLQVEVQEVRINPTTASAGAYDRGGGMATSMFSQGQGSGESQTFQAEPNLVPVVIQGVIYIFNEPDVKILQVTDDQA